VPGIDAADFQSKIGTAEAAVEPPIRSFALASTSKADHNDTVPPHRGSKFMSRHRLTVVLSQSPSKHPAKRSLEESLAAALIMEPGLDISVLPHLYDLDAQHTGRLFLESVSGDMVVLSWLFPRAAFWLLDRDGIQGHFGETQIKPPELDEDDEEEKEEPELPKGIGAGGSVRDRHIYCINLSDGKGHVVFVEEIRRIAAECRERRDAKQAEKAKANPTLISLGMPSSRGHETENSELGNGKSEIQFSSEQLLAAPNRRWYPVIDYSRCTNCLECLDFCLFGVYGVDNVDRILVEHQDNCKKGCPACSRVCPEHAIMFPDYKTPAIAGAAVGSAGALKIDLTKLFGGEAKDALAQAVLERDKELVADGRQAVGLSVGIPKRQTDKPPGPKDELDKLMDDLDALEL
jgi:NAD-dependent dihydropyrimidine dehydrogenase PreA subunit